MIRLLYRLLRILTLFNAAKRGPSGLGRYYARRSAYRGTRSLLRKLGL